MGYKVKIEQFEGPFDLLVFLLESARMNIYDINISEITNQYLSHLEEMEKMDVVVSSEFMVLAAELIQLKSKMLLPQTQTGEGEELGDDPRNELVSKLLEYKKFKEISRILEEREETNRGIMEKPREDISQYTDNPEETIFLDMNQFVQGFHVFIHRKKKVAEMQKRYEGVSIYRETPEKRMKFIEKLVLEDIKSEVGFSKLVGEEKSTYNVALTFSTLLEMVRKQTVLAKQDSLYGEIRASGTKKLRERGK